MRLERAIQKKSRKKKKKHKDINLKIELINFASHHIEYDKPSEFIKLIKQELN